SFKLQQPQDKVSVTAGGTLTLNCTISGDGPLGPVKWLKGWGSENKTIYDQTGTFPHVTRVVNGSNTDFSIRMRDVQPADMGTYYCVKFDKGVNRDLVVFAHGKGTEVSVLAKPSSPVVSGPEHRVGTGKSVPFTCTARGFFPQIISMKWFKDRTQISAQQPPNITAQTPFSYSMSIKVTVTLQKEDVLSQLVCEVQHPTLGVPLRGTYQLGNVLRVSPSVRVVGEPQSPVELNKTVNFSCHVESFYPGDVAVTWLENSTKIKVENVSQVMLMPSGLFKLTSLLEVQATVEKNGSVFTCQVVHDGQGPISSKTTLWIHVPTK
ncbi:SIRBL protein, partial [Brachypteracias leptosomus]|nr:SIRBL protein [Brachypteracias leptosomus]